MADTLGAYNPLRYRGYVYDEETSLYYLQSRYYDSAMGRFINADAFATTGQGLIGNNMFAYCNNNPVNLVDHNGDFGILAYMAIGAFVGFASQYISDVVNNVKDGKTGGDIFKISGSLGDYISSVITGAITSIPGAGPVVSVVCDFAAPAIQQGIDCTFDKDTEWDWEKYAVDVSFNLVFDAVASAESMDLPQNIRDIKTEARASRIKGTNRLQPYLKRAQSEVFLSNKGIELTVSSLESVYHTTFNVVFSLN